MRVVRLVGRRVAIDGSGIAAVGGGGPRVMSLVEATIYIVPAGIDDHAVVVHARLPFVGLMRAEHDNITAIGIHGMQGETGNRAAMAPPIAAAALGNKHDSSARQVTGIELIPNAIGQLGEPAAVKFDAEIL